MFAFITGFLRFRQLGLANALLARMIGFVKVPVSIFSIEGCARLLKRGVAARRAVLVVLLAPLFLVAPFPGTLPGAPESVQWAYGQEAPLPTPPPTPPLPADPELRLIESLYREGDGYRAETEILRLVHFHPRHPQRPLAELARAKLYFQAGRHRESDLMAFSLLDRFPRSRAAAPARRLLAFSMVRQGHYEAARPHLAYLAGRGEPVPTLAEFAGPPPGAVDPEAARAWSTWLPGTGYFLLDQPGKAAAALSLNLALLAAAVQFTRDDNPGAGLLFLVFELMLWQGGRDGVRQDAEKINRRLRERRADDWARRHGEPELLRIGFQVAFGGR